MLTDQQRITEEAVLEVNKIKRTYLTIIGDDGQHAQQLTKSANTLIANLQYVGQLTT